MKDEPERHINQWMQAHTMSNSICG